MNETPDKNRIATENAVRELAQLGKQTRQARATLLLLQEELFIAQSRLAQSRDACQLLEANEQRMLATLPSRTAERAMTTMPSLAAGFGEIDELTELPNRTLLLKRLEQTISRTGPEQQGLALLLLDLNNFRQINDTLGHAAGDQLLKQIAHSLGSSVRGADIVCRYGGDEFVILLDNVAQKSEAAAVAEKVINALCTPDRMGEHVLRLTVSIGISLYPQDGHEACALIDRADAAMSRAKRYALGGFLFYSDGFQNERALEIAVPASLKNPLAHYEWTLAEHERRHLQLREANEQLVLAALDAQELQAAAEQAHQQQKDLLAMVAHELRNPLAPLSMTAGMLVRVKTEELPRMQAIIERQVQHMSRLVDDLLDVSRADAGKLHLQRQATDMTAIIHQAVEICRPAMDARLQRFTVHVPTRVLEVNGDPIRLGQILSNLLGNASKYTPNAGVIDLSVVVTEHSLVIRLSDNGIGITAKALPFVFDPFVQDAHAIGFNGAGLGIGLTVVRELVDAHGGSVAASSGGDGLGSQFVVTLPLLGHFQ